MGAWRAREAQLLADNETLAARNQQLTVDMHEIKAECLTKELQHKSTTTELELKASQAAAAQLNTRHQLRVAQEKLRVMEEEIRQLSDTNARLAGQCNSVQVEASLASQKLHISQHEYSKKLKVLEDRIAATHDLFREQIDAQESEAIQVQKKFQTGAASMDSQMDLLQV